MLSITYPNPLVFVREDVEDWVHALITQQMKDRESYFLSDIDSYETILDTVTEICQEDTEQSKCLRLSINSDTTRSKIWKPISDLLSIHQELNLAVILKFPTDCIVPSVLQPRLNYVFLRGSESAICSLPYYICIDCLTQAYQLLYIS